MTQTAESLGDFRYVIPLTAGNGKLEAYPTLILKVLQCDCKNEERPQA